MITKQFKVISYESSAEITFAEDRDRICITDEGTGYTIEVRQDMLDDVIQVLNTMKSEN